MSRSRLLTFIEVHCRAGRALTTVMTMWRNVFRIKKAPAAPSEEFVGSELRPFALSLEALHSRHLRQAASRIAALDRQDMTCDIRLVSARLVGHRRPTMRLLEQQWAQLSSISSIDDEAQTAHLCCRGTHRDSLSWGCW